MRMNKLAATLPVVAAALIVQVWGVSLAVAQSYNIDNTPFNTISSGPQGVAIVDVANPDDPAAVSAALKTKFTITRSAGSGRFARQLEFFRKAGLLRGDENPSFDQVVFLRSGGQLVTAQDNVTRAAGNEITFNYQGWTATEQSQLQAFANIVYPVAREIYGDPARNITVSVIKEGTGSTPIMSDREALMGGIYVVSTSPRQMIIPATTLRATERSFLRLMLRAFHDNLMFSYPAWEEGFIRAASVVISKRVDSTLQSQGLADLAHTDDPMYNLLPYYDLLNQPALGNNTFTPDSFDLVRVDMFGGMLIPRLGMSTAAWLKVYTEYRLATGRHFFSAFNNLYYQQAVGSPSLQNSVPGLKSVAATLVPEVEGLVFGEWYRRQWAMNTSVSLGKKLYVYNIPVPDDPTVQDDDFSAIVFLIHYNTTQSGDEQPLNGTCFPVYWNWRYDTDLFPGAQYEQISVINGEGSAMPTFYPSTLGGTQRITFDLTINNESVRVYFPAGVAGTEASPSNFYGAILGSDGGTLSVTAANPASSPPATTATQGVFSVNLASGLTDLNQVTMTYTAGGSTVTRKVNTGYGSYIALLEGVPSVKTLPRAIDAGLRMITFPVTALERDHAAALGIAANRLLLAHWQPDVLGVYKYEMYDPASSRIAPIVPGRGYWIKLDSAATISATGITADPTVPSRIGLLPGWNQIGSPFETSVPVSTIMVENGNDEPVTLDQAVAQGVVANTIWGYSTANSQYFAASSLQPWEGYWIKCNSPTGAVLIVPAAQVYGSLTSGVSRTAVAGDTPQVSPLSKLNWKVEIAATRSDGGSTSAYMAMAPAATDAFDNIYDTEAPPPFEKGLSVGFKMQGRSDGLLNVDARCAGATKSAWDLEIDAGGANKDVVVTWPNLSAIPKNYRLTLVDSDTNRKLYMRTTSSYRFASGDSGVRRFQVIADASPVAPLRITGITSAPSRGGSMSFSYGLTTDAATTVEIARATGDTIRRLQQGQPSRSGLNSLAWDMRDSSGESISPGVYILKMTARTEEGEAAKAIHPIMIVR